MDVYTIAAVAVLIMVIVGLLIAGKKKPAAVPNGDIKPSAPESRADPLGRAATRLSSEFRRAGFRMVGDLIDTVREGGHEQLRDRLEDLLSIMQDPDKRRAELLDVVKRFLEDAFRDETERASVLEMVSRLKRQYGIDQADAVADKLPEIVVAMRRIEGHLKPDEQELLADLRSRLRKRK